MPTVLESTNCKLPMPTLTRLRVLVSFNLACVFWLSVLCTPTYAAAPKPPGDPFGRGNPRSTVTNFLEACHGDDYQRASQYLDLRQIPLRVRPERGIQVAKQLEAILNSDSQFDILRISQQPQGDLSDQNNPSIERIAVITRDGQSFPIELERVQLQADQQVWLFSAQTISELPGLTPNTTESAIEARLPRFLVHIQLLETPLWKWIALVALAITVFLIFRIA